VKHNLPFIRERLLDGALLKSGILEREKVEGALFGRPTNVDPTELLTHVGTEMWLESVRACTARDAHATAP
jgi:hypothetical protein